MTKAGNKKFMMMIFFCQKKKIYLDIPDTFNMWCPLSSSAWDHFITSHIFLLLHLLLVWFCTEIHYLGRRIIYHSITFHPTLLRLNLTHYIGHLSSAIANNKQKNKKKYSKISHASHISSRRCVYMNFRNKDTHLSTHRW